MDRIARHSLARLRRLGSEHTTTCGGRAERQGMRRAAERQQVLR